jgi:hypothetical protein
MVDGAQQVSHELGRVFGRGEVAETFHNFCWQTGRRAILPVNAQSTQPIVQLSCSLM